MTKTCLYTNVQNEERIVEFLKYYIKLGIDYFIILDDNSIKDVKDILLENNFNLNNFSVLYLGKRKFFDVYCSKTHWDNEVLPILNDKNIDYVLYVDADEFLYLNKFKHINELINFYSPFDSLKINWLLFGSCKIIKNNSNSIINTFNKSNNVLAWYVKSITKVLSIDTSKIVGHNSHVLTIKDNCVSKNILNNIIPQSNASNNSEGGGVINYKDAPIYIAHYILQDVFTYIDRKVTSFMFNRVARNGLVLTNEEIKLINENKNLISKYIIENDVTQTNNYLSELQKNGIKEELIQFYKKHFEFIDKNNNSIINNDIKEFYNM
jgi:hypothetical protein